MVSTTGTRKLGAWLVLSFAFCLGQASAQRHMERLTRGLVAVPADGGTYLSWRLFGTEPSNLGFNVYKGSAKLNDEPLTGATLFTDKTSGAGTYTVRPVVNGQEGAPSEPARVFAGGYFSINLSIPAGSYTANDASVGDVDGDGEYEIILKWDPTNSKDNSQDGVTGNVFLDAYKLDGTRLWRIDLGRNIRAGAHYTQFMVADFDGDGKAEVICKTGDGTIDGAGKVIGDATADHRNSRGYIMKGPEFMTIFEGATGKAMQTVDYNPPRGDVCSWGDPDCDTYANRVDRFLAAVAYLDGVLPSAVMCRGYYTRAVLAAWDWRGGKLTQRWVFDTSVPGTPPGYTGQGAHSLSVADVDQDGKDEIIYGGAAIDDNGKALWTTRLGHGDALHVGDFDPSRPGLEVWMIHEGGTQPGADLRNAKTGEVYWKTAPEDVARGVAADILESNPGAEFWGPSGGVRNAAGQTVNVGTGSQNFAAWWDGDLLRELLDGTRIHKAGGASLLTATGCAANNSTKSTPNLSADLFGDWREEVMWRTSDSRQLRIYTTTIPTTYRFYTLMHNPAYRAAIAWQNVGYNQPPHVDYYLGTGMTLPPPKPNIVTDLGAISILKAGRAPAAAGGVLYYAGGDRIALPLGFTSANRVVLLRDAFGRVRARGVPRQGYLHGVGALPKGVYSLQLAGEL